jgi:hypothetical protein
MWVIFALLDPNPDPEPGYGYTDLLESGSDPDPKRCSTVAERCLILIVKLIKIKISDIGSTFLQEDGEEEEAGAELEARLQAAASEAEEGMNEADLPRENSSAPSTIPNPLRALGGQPLKRVKHKNERGDIFWDFFSYCIPVLLIREVYPGSRMRLFSIPDPGSELSPSRIPDSGSASKNLSILTPKKPKKWFLSSRKYDPDCSSRLPDPDADFLPFPDPGSGSATLLYSTLLHLPPLRFHCADECWDRTQAGPLQLLHWQSDALSR